MTDKFNDIQLQFDILIMGAKGQGDNPINWHRRILLLQEELRLGNWDYERLLVDRERYSVLVKENKGKTSWNSKQYKFDVLEARYIMKFLNSWEMRRARLEREIEECALAIGNAH